MDKSKKRLNDVSGVVYQGKPIDLAKVTFPKNVKSGINRSCCGSIGAKEEVPDLDFHGFWDGQEVDSSTLYACQDVVQTTKDGETKTIDLTPVHDYVSLLESSFKGRYPLMGDCHAAELIEKANIMTKDQLLFLVSQLSSMMREKVRENRYLCTKSGIKSTCQLRKLVKQVDKSSEEYGHETVWEDANDLRE